MNLGHLLRAQFVGIRDLKIHLSALLHKNKPLVVTERGKPKHFVVPYDEMIEIVEILEEAADQKLVAAIDAARAAYRNGQWIPLNFAKLRSKLRA